MQNVYEIHATLHSAASLEFRKYGNVFLPLAFSRQQAVENDRSGKWISLDPFVLLCCYIFLLFHMLRNLGGKLS